MLLAGLVAPSALALAQLGFPDATPAGTICISYWRCETNRLYEGTAFRHDAACVDEIVTLSRGPQSLPDCLQLFQVKCPSYCAPGYELVGEVSCEGVQGTALLEAWTYFDDARYFTRTLAPDGPMSPIEGDQPWRAFRVPFTFDQTPGPDFIEFSLYMPGAGTVKLRNIELRQLPETDHAQHE